VIDARNISGSTPLDYAVQGDSKECVQALLVRGARVNIKDSAGNTPLFTAVRYQRADCVRLLLAGGAQVNMKNKLGQTPMSFANVRSDPSTFKMLTQAGAK
jgi:ankyrin repeat protein